MPVRADAGAGEGGMSSYRRKPVEIDARQLTADNLVEIADWVSDAGTRCDQFETHIWMGPWITTRGDEHYAHPGDWIVRERGKFEIVRAADFATAYEPVP